MSTTEPSDDADGLVTDTTNIGYRKQLILSTIKDQASDLEHGWREAISNGRDAPNSENVWLWFDQHRSIIHDDGDGRDLTDEDEQRLLTDMGATDKARDDDDEIGQFGVGKGQYIAKGRTATISNGYVLFYDINEWGVKDGVNLTTVENAPSFARNHNEEWGEYVEEAIEKHDGEGLTVLIHHYEDEVPDRSYKWETYENKIRKRFKYVGLTSDVNIHIQDELISDADPTEELHGNTCDYTVFNQITTGKVHIAIRQDHDSEIDVYSNGVFVKSVNGDGFGGTIITHRNLDLNYARNEIKSGCQIWNDIKTHLNEVKLDLAENASTDSMNRNMREFFTRNLFSDTDIDDELAEKPIFRTPDGDYVSLDEILNKGELCFGKSHDPAAKQLSKESDTPVLDAKDKGSEVLKKTIEEDTKYDDTDTDDSTSENPSKTKEAIKQVEQVDVEERADEETNFTKKEPLGLAELTPLQRTKLGVARELAKKMGIDRTIYFGQGDGVDAWTNGSDKIVFTDTAIPQRSWNQWIYPLYSELCKQSNYNYSNKEEQTSTRSRRSDSWEAITDNEDALLETIAAIEDHGIRSFRLDPEPDGDT